MRPPLEGFLQMDFHDVGRECGGFQVGEVLGDCFPDASEGCTTGGASGLASWQRGYCSDETAVFAFVDEDTKFHFAHAFSQGTLRSSEQ